MSKGAQKAISSRFLTQEMATNERPAEKSLELKSMTAFLSVSPTFCG